MTGNRWNTPESFLDIHVTIQHVPINDVYKYAHTISNEYLHIYVIDVIPT